MEIVRALLKEGCEIRAYDPAAAERAQEVLPREGMIYAKSAYEAAKGADALLILTDWPEFAKLDLPRLKEASLIPSWSMAGTCTIPPRWPPMDSSIPASAAPTCSHRSLVRCRRMASWRLPLPERLVTKMRALVTGGAGFLGSHLCDALLAEGHAVVCVDNLITGREENIAHLANDPGFEFQHYDICQPFDFGKVDYVFNFASPASPVDYMEHGIPTSASGIVRDLQRAGIAKRHGAKFFMASTSECYGDPEQHPQSGNLLGTREPDRAALRV